MEKVRKMFVPEIKADGDDRTVRVTLSTESIDRDNDRISVDGWELSQFRANPCVCWSHRYDVPAIAKATHIGVKNGKLQATAQFPAEGTYDLSDTVYRLVREKIIRGVSVGFRPIEYTIDSQRGGYNFQRQSLLEFSFCNVPSNADCLVQARALGISDQKLKALGIIEKEEEEEGYIMVTDNKDGFLVDVDYLKSTLRQAVKELVANQARSSLAKTVQPYTETQLRQFEPQIRYNEEKAEAERRIQANPVGKINSDWCPVSPGPRGWL